MTTSYLTLSLAVWGLLAATVIGVAIHTITTQRRTRAFTDHTMTALTLVQSCWPARDVDDDCVRCGSCDALWTTDRVCPKAAR